MQAFARLTGLLLIAGTLFSPLLAIAQTEEDTGIRLHLRPHCSQGYTSETWIYGTVPAPGWTLDENPLLCPPFTVRDPQTLETTPLSNGDTLDLDLVVENPNGLPISAVRAWIDYDTSVLRGADIYVSTGTFQDVSPTEQYFDTETAQMKLQVSNTVTPNTSYWVPVAQLRFEVIEEITPGTVLSFFDVQPSGHTSILAQTEGQERDVLQQDPGALLVRIEPAPAEPAPQEPADTSTGILLAPVGAACMASAECESQWCVQGICTVQQPTTETPPSPPAETDEAPVVPEGQQGVIPIGGTCVLSTQCVTNFCTEGVCKDPETHRNDRTAFSMLQVRNPRVTTEGDIAYLAWEDLRSSMLKGYNVYYGATSGQYIQRKTVPGTTPSITIRNLPEGTTYYFAVRAVSIDDEESAFSQEVAVDIGDPATSTAPLLAQVITDAPGTNPLAETTAQEVPGETGIPLMMTLLLVAAAAIGTLMAVRRQTLVHCTIPPRHD